MSGSHRAERKRRSAPLRLLLGLLAVVLVVALVVAAGVLVRSWLDEDPAGAPTGASSPTGTPTPSSGPTGTPTTEPSPSRTTPSRTAPALPAVPTAPPSRLVVDGLVDSGFDNAIEPTGDRLVPTSADELARLGTRGTPGSPADDTVIVAGAATTTGTGAFDRLDEIGVGDEISLETYAGTLGYTVRSRTTADPDAVLDLAAVRAENPRRLVLVVAHYDGGDRQGDDLVVVADLTDAVAAG